MTHLPTNVRVAALELSNPKQLSSLEIVALDLEGPVQESDSQ